MIKNNLKISIIFLVSVVVILSVYLITKKDGIILSVPTTSQVSKITEKKIEDKNDFYDISVTYPVDSRDKESAVEKFVTYKIDEKKSQWKIGGEAYLEEKKIESDFPDRPKMQYQYSITYKKYESKKFNTVSYLFTVYEFTGGANGNITVNTFTFDGKGAVTIDSVLDFNDGKDIVLSRVLAETLIKSEGENASKDMVNDGLGLSYLKADGKTFDAQKCGCDGFFFGSNFQNFVIEDEGLRFIFNKYQVAPGASGLPEVVLPWNALKTFIVPSFTGLKNI
jgi:hypothetical protein